VLLRETTVPINKNDARLRKPFLLLCFFVITNSAPEDTNAPRKIHKRSCTAFRKLMCIRTQCSWKKPSASSEETFRFSEEAFQFAHSCPANAFQKNVSNVGVIFFLMCTVTYIILRIGDITLSSYATNFIVQSITITDIILCLVPSHEKCDACNTYVYEMPCTRNSFSISHTLPVIL